MNAMEHGNGFDADLPVDIAVARVGGRGAAVRITDQGGGREIPPAETPDLEAKLEGAQSPARLGPVPDPEHGRRGARLDSDEHHHTLELVMRLKGEERTMSRPRLEATIDRHAEAASTIELAGDIDGGARDALDAAYTAAARRASRCCSTSRTSTTSTRPGSP